MFYKDIIIHRIEDFAGDCKFFLRQKQANLYAYPCLSRSSQNLRINQIRKNNFFHSIFAVIHQPHPCHLVTVSGFYVSVVNAMLIHGYRNNSLRRAKTDVINLADYGINHQLALPRYIPEDEVWLMLKTT